MTFWMKIYAPWCGHCQSLEPTYNNLAKHLRSVDSLVVAKMDGTTNEHPRAKVCITNFEGRFWLTIHFLENVLLPCFLLYLLFLKLYYGISDVILIFMFL